MPLRPGLLVALAVAIALTACDGTAPETGPAPTSTHSYIDREPPTEPEPIEPLPEPITIAFAGDIHFEGPLRARLDDPATALAPVTAKLAAADLAIVNLETSVGEGGRPEPGKRFTFQAPASALTALSEAGIDVATMANNHALDYGREALGSTFAAIRRAGRSGLQVVGIGKDDASAFRPATSTIGETTVATIGATVAALDPTADPTGQWAATPTTPGTADAVDPRLLLESVRDADHEFAVVVVYMHWGVQGETCTTEDQRSLTKRLVEAGADVVVGSHAHVVQGAEPFADAFVAYGLGNYAWYQPSETGVLTLSVQPPAELAERATVTDAAWEPARVGSDGLPVAVGGSGRLDPPCEIS